jgi:dimethylsulfoniopropionate demethylase
MPSVRIRRTPFSRRVEQAGVTAYTVYNHMLLPQMFKSLQEDCAHLKRAVQVWDVACQRQVEIVGPDSRRLLQMTTPRDISIMEDDQCFYAPMVDTDGGMLNDPVVIRLEQDRYWLSIADSDMVYYCKGLAGGMNLDVKVFEPDVSPLAIQGPKADELMDRAFGPEIVETRFFRYRTINFGGKEMIVARSGYSHQGGYEIYLDGADLGEALWDRLFDAGKDLDVRAGCPNGIERVEAGLLSFGADLTNDNTPYEAGLGKFCDLHKAVDCLGHAALISKQEPTRQIRAVAISGPAVPTPSHRWPLIDDEGKHTGHISSAAWSPVFETNVAIGLVHREHWNPGTKLTAQTPDGDRHAYIQTKFWI